MSIPVVPDDLGPPYENCCFCRKASRTWYAKKDVPVCVGCADVHEPSEVPSKVDWYNAEQLRAKKGRLKESA